VDATRLSRAASARGSHLIVAPRHWCDAMKGLSRSVSFCDSVAHSRVYLTFEVEVETRWGDSVVLVGSTPQLGSWDPHKGLPMTTTAESYPIWRLGPKEQTEVATECSFEYKIVILRTRPAHGDRQLIEAEWEPLLQNRWLTLGDAEVSGDLHMNSRWGQSHTLVWTLLPRPSERAPTLGALEALHRESRESRAKSTAS